MAGEELAAKIQRLFLKYGNSLLKQSGMTKLSTDAKCALPILPAMNTMPKMRLLFLLFLLSSLGCQSSETPETQPDWHDASGLPVISDPDAYAQALLLQWGALVWVPELLIDFSSEPWRFGVGDPVNGLEVTYDERPSLDTTITLPHRILKPNWPLWYEADLPLDSPGWLYINADDGAQVFQDGRLLEPVDGEYFSVTASKASKITIRVLNNALRGGLQEVMWIGEEDFDYKSRQAALRLRLRKLVYEALQVRSLSQDRYVLVSEAIDQQTPEAMEAAEGAVGSALIYPRLQSINNDGADSFSFTAWGDSQGGWTTFQGLVNSMADKPAAFSIGLGDLVSNGASADQWLSFTMALQPLLKKQPVFPVAGNHDYDGYYNDLVPDLYYAHTRTSTPDVPYFSWQYRGAYFLAIDPNQNFPLSFDEQQLKWMLDEMNSSAWATANWRFILLHQAPYSQGWPGYEGDAFIRELVDSLAAPKQIDFVLTGHSHNYERLTKTYGDQQTHFLVLGGAGGGLEPPESSPQPEMDRVIKEHHYARFQVGPEVIQVAIIGLDDQVLDALTVQKNGPFKPVTSNQ